MHDIYLIHEQYKSQLILKLLQARIFWKMDNAIHWFQPLNNWTGAVVTYLEYQTLVLIVAERAKSLPDACLQLKQFEVPFTSSSGSPMASVILLVSDRMIKSGTGQNILRDSGFKRQNLSFGV